MTAGDIQLGSGNTLYTQLGDLFVFGAFSALVLGVFRRRSAFIYMRASEIPLATNAIFCKPRSNSKETP